MLPQFTNCLALSIAFLLLPGLLAAQQPTQQTPNDSAALAKAVSLYYDHVGDEAAIYNGRAYQPHDGNLQGGDPYFGAPLSVIGSLTFDGLDYTGVPLLFDLVRNLLIVTDPKGQLLSLYNDKVQKFSIGRHHFLQLNIEGTPDFYELVRPGHVSFLIRRSKKIEEKIQYDALQHFITVHDAWFLDINGQYHPFSSENSLLKLLEDKKKPIRQFIRSQDIKYSDDPEKAISRIIDFYNQQPR
jgi:hypothetical protein